MNAFRRTVVVLAWIMVWLVLTAAQVQSVRLGLSSPWLAAVLETMVGVGASISIAGRW